MARPRVDGGRREPGVRSRQQLGSHPGSPGVAPPPWPPNLPHLTQSVPLHSHRGRARLRSQARASSRISAGSLKFHGSSLTSPSVSSLFRRRWRSRSNCGATEGDSSAKTGQRRAGPDRCQQRPDLSPIPPRSPGPGRREMLVTRVSPRLGARITTVAEPPGPTRSTASESQRFDAP